MKKLDLKTVPKNLKPDPLFAGMTDYLKDPANFEEVEKKLISILKTKHRHKTASAYVKCALCNAKRLERQREMREMGFASIQQYLGWKKIMTIIKGKKSFQLN